MFVCTFVMVRLASTPCEDETAANSAILSGAESTMLAASGCGVVEGWRMHLIALETAIESKMRRKFLRIFEYLIRMSGVIFDWVTVLRGSLRHNYSIEYLLHSSTVDDIASLNCRENT